MNGMSPLPHPFGGRPEVTPLLLATPLDCKSGRAHRLPLPKVKLTAPSGLPSPASHSSLERSHALEAAAEKQQTASFQSDPTAHC